MSPDAAPILVAYDGSAPSDAAVRAAVRLFAGRRLVVATAWEPGLAYVALAPAPGFYGAGTAWPSPREVRAVDDAQRERARAIALAGAGLARRMGALVDVVAEPDALDVVEAIVGLADRLGADAIVIGTRGIGGARAHLLGSTTRRLLHDTRRAVVVVREDRHDDRSAAPSDRPASARRRAPAFHDSANRSGPRV
jgi:nucleotide-binding universal stress UspA family protein